MLWRTLFLSLIAASCGRADADLLRGASGGTCYPNGTCNTGLFCTNDNRCMTSGEDWCSFAGGDLTLNGDAVLQGARLRVANDDYSEISSAFCNRRVAITRFATEFSVYMPVAAADGMTFTVQNDGPEALGSFGGGLGYGGDPDDPPEQARIAYSAAVKLDLYDNSGEGPSSTGVYVNGADPGIPASDLRPAGIDLHSTHVFRVRVEYGSGVLDLTITDTATAATFHETYAVDVPGTVADNLAWVGFTGATGGKVAVIEVYDWSFGE